MTNPPVGPRFRLAPGIVLRGGRRPPLPSTPQPADPPTSEPRPADPDADDRGPQTADPDPDDPGFRNTRWDRAELAVSVDPVWLLAPLYARDAAGLHPPGDLPGPLDPAPPRIPVTAVDVPAAASEWPAWWAAALAYRPGTPAPRQEDLVAGSPASERLWSTVAEPFDAWVAARPGRGPGSDAAARAVERAALDGFSAANGREPGRWTVRILQIPVTGDYLHSPDSRRIVVSAALRADPDRYATALNAELPRHF